MFALSAFPSRGALDPSADMLERHGCFYTLGALFVDVLVIRGVYELGSMLGSLIVGNFHMFHASLGVVPARGHGSLRSPGAPRTAKAMRDTLDIDIHDSGLHLQPHTCLRPCLSKSLFTAVYMCRPGYVRSQHGSSLERMLRALQKYCAVEQKGLRALRLNMKVEGLLMGLLSSIQGPS